MSASDPQVPDTEGFEGALAALEDRVRKLEDGEVSLDEGLALYEQGVELARRCHGLLDRAEERVAEVVRGGSGPELRPMDDPSLD
ncbi:MAG: exodeoxyribonuclease VII small subunit [Myxococcota bacterium]